MAKPDNKGTYNFQDWLTWEGAWELINGKAFNMSPAPTSLHDLLWVSCTSLTDFFSESEMFCVCCPF